MDSLDREKKWKTHIVVEKRSVPSWRRYYSGSAGDTCDPSQMYDPPDVEGTVKEVVKDGEYTIDELSLY